MTTKPCETCGKLLIGVKGDRRILQRLCHTPTKSVSEQ